MKLTSTLNEDNWQVIPILDVRRILSDIPIPWWVAGGLAIELFVGQPIREHKDTDVLILRKDQHRLHDYLAEWDLYKTNQPGLKPWLKGEPLECGVNQLWCRRTTNSPWSLEVMLMDTDINNQQWIYRRVPDIGGALSTMGRQTSDGIWYLSPEIQLLYKARKQPFQKDEQDFTASLPLLEPSKKAWLASALQRQFPEGHPWIQPLLR